MSQARPHVCKRHGQWVATAGVVNHFQFLARRVDRPEKIFDYAGQTMKNLNPNRWARQTALALPLLMGTLLVSCGKQDSNVFFEQYQVAPNTAPTCNDGKSSDCLLVREGYDTGGFGQWVTATRAQLPNFQYEPGYLYDVTAKLGCGKGGFGDGLIEIREIIVKVKTPSQTTASGTASLRFGFC